MLSENTQAPDFSLPTNAGGTFALHSYAGKKNVAIYFYPKDSTPGCTTEARNFKEAFSNFQELDTVIVGISKDSITSHDKFATTECLPFPLASDVDGRVCETYGVWAEKSMYGKKYMGIERTTLLIGKDGLIKKIWNKVSVTGHVKEVLNAIKTLC